MTKRAVVILIAGLLLAGILYAIEKSELSKETQLRDEANLIIEELNMTSVQAIRTTQPKALIIGDVSTRNEYSRLKDKLGEHYSNRVVEQLLTGVHIRPPGEFQD